MEEVIDCKQSNHINDEERIQEPYSKTFTNPALHRSAQLRRTNR